MRTEWKTLAGRIRWLLEDRRIDQRTFGERAGQSPGTIGAFLSRAKQKPDATMNADVLAALVVAWGVTPAWLLLGVGDPYNAAAPAPTAPRFRDSPHWQAAVSGATETDPKVRAWAFEAVGDWPAPPQGVAISEGLVLDLARVVARYYPAVADSPPGAGRRQAG